MKRLVAMFSIFALASLVAAYVALAPNAPAVGPGLLRNAFATLDGLSEQLASLAGRGVAVMGLLVLGIVVGLLAALAIADGTPGEPRRRRGEPDREPVPAPPWRPEPMSQDDRIANLRRRAGSLAEAELQPPAEPVGQRAPPVVLIRKPRERERDWFSDTSWFGGLPRLGEQAWPRDSAGIPLPFAAQIDLAELAAACPESPLPSTGALAFFLGSGAVVRVEHGEWGRPDFSDTPDDLPPAFDEGGLPLPARPTRLSRGFFPYWPVELMPLAVPRDLASRAGPDRETAILRALAARMPALVAARPRAFRASDNSALAEGLWWHSVRFLADQLHVALAASERPLALRRDRLARARDEALGGEDAGADAQIATLEAEIARIERQRNALPTMVQALDGFVGDRSLWERLSAAEQSLVGEILAEVSANYAELMDGMVPASIGDLATVSLRAMVSGPPEALAQVPDEALTRINREHRLAARAQHRLLGPDVSGESVLLLQLGADDLMEWRWEETKVFRFRIARDDAQAGNWAAATLAFEDA